ncbi:MAG: hypothetical protein IRZ03_08495 [Acidobacterium ailaaui]|nr:hypothetical protein [Pseudacidobacterium ailaaui]
MAITSFIPEIWNAALLQSFREQAVAANLVNRQYEGNAASGNVVHINFAGNIPVNNYKTGATINGTQTPRTTVPGAVSTTKVDLLIDQEKAFDFLVDDIDRVQAAGSLDVFASNAAAGLAEDADKFILATAAGASGISNLSPSTHVDLTATGAADEVFNVIRDLRKSLNKNHVPMGSRVLIINAEFEAALLAADAKLTDASVAGDAQGLRNATLGNLLGFRVVTTENLPETDEAMALAFYQPAVAYVSQIEKTEAMRDVNSFSDRLRGLHVYGGLVVRPEAVALWKNPPAAG